VTEQDPRALALAGWGSAVLFAAAFLDRPLRAWAAAQEPAARAAWDVATGIGDSGWMIAATAALGLWALAERGMAASTRRRAGLAAAAGVSLTALAAVALIGLAAAALKLVIGRPRPKMFESLGAFELSPLAFDFKLNSFPSGHATTLFALAAILCLVLPRWRALILAAAGWGAFSRVAVGAHYASDVLAGAALGYYGARAFARGAAARGWGFGPDLAPLGPRDAAAALRRAARRRRRQAARAIREKAHASSRAALRRRRADEERG
jgi:undecaprenyl-diphosphatase